MNEAAITGYYVTFTPVDTVNYTTATAMATLIVNKVAPTPLEDPTPINSTYNGVAENLITEGKADGGTMKYWITDDPNLTPPTDNSLYSSTIPSRANAGTYRIWYKIIGDENHFDSPLKSLYSTIRKYVLDIGEQKVTYNGNQTLTIPLNGASDSIRKAACFLKQSHVSPLLNHVTKNP